MLTIRGKTLFPADSELNQAITVNTGNEGAGIETRSSTPSKSRAPPRRPGTLDGPLDFDGVDETAPISRPLRGNVRMVIPDITSARINDAISQRRSLGTNFYRLSPELRVRDRR